jgi:hypothetical protein
VQGSVLQLENSGNAYLKAHGVEVNHFEDHSSTFLTLEQYAEVSDSLLILSFLTTCESC